MSNAAIPDGADTVTVLRVKGGKLLTKRWTRFEGTDREISYDRAWRFSATEHRVSNVRTLGEFIHAISLLPPAFHDPTCHPELFADEVPK
jgi:hypothetical protein